MYRSERPLYFVWLLEKVDVISCIFINKSCLHKVSFFLHVNNDAATDSKFNKFSELITQPWIATVSRSEVTPSPLAHPNRVPNLFSYSRYNALADPRTHAPSKSKYFSFMQFLEKKMTKWSSQSFGNRSIEWNLETPPITPRPPPLDPYTPPLPGPHHHPNLCPYTPDPAPPDPHHPLPPPPPWQSFVYSFGHYFMGRTT